jgi:hypothetical protein
MLKLFDKRGRNRLPMNEQNSLARMIQSKPVSRDVNLIVSKSHRPDRIEIMHELTASLAGDQIELAGIS